MFKVGDWVVEKGSKRPLRLTDRFINVIEEVGEWQDFELWNPKECEWCWFSNSILFDEFIFGQFSEMGNGLYCGTSSEGIAFQALSCRPFIGETSFLKDTK